MCRKRMAGLPRKVTLGATVSCSCIISGVLFAQTQPDQQASSRAVTPLGTANATQHAPSSTLPPQKTEATAPKATVAPTATAAPTASATPKATVAPTATAAPTASATPKATVAPTVAPTAAVVPTVAATPTPVPLPPVNPSRIAMLHSTLILNLENRADLALARSARSNVGDAGRDDQFALLGPASGGLSGTEWLFQRRFNPFSDFALFSKENADASDYEALRNAFYIQDTASFCPLTREVLFLGPGIDDRGRPLKNNKGRRVYLFSLATGNLSLVWRMEKNMHGKIGTAVSATPDCKHLLVNLHLETEQARTPFGKLVYLKREATRWTDWQEVSLADSPKNGVMKNFGTAVFAVPPDARYYKPSPTPPPVLAVQDFVDAEANKPRVFLYNPAGSGHSWTRSQIGLDGPVRRVLDVSFYNKLSEALVLLEKQEGDGARTSVLGFVPLEDPSRGFQDVAISANIHLTKADLHPWGNRIAASFVRVRADSGSSGKPETDLPAAGVLEITLNKQGKAVYSVLESLQPFHGLAGHHDPRPLYTGDGTRLVYGVPEISEAADPSLFEVDAKVNSQYQFPVKLVQWKLGE